jgi:Tfp pilus assembly protein PilN
MAQHLITGVVLRQSNLAWTTLRRTKTGWEIAEQNQDPLSPEATGPDSPVFGEALKRWAAHHRGEISFGLPAERVLLRVTDLPTADLSEMQAMVELQVDKFSPFPAEQMALSFEVLAQRGTASRVLIAAVQRDLVNAVGEAFRAAGVWPERLDVDILGWWAALKERGELPAEGLYVALRVDASGAALIVADRGVPVVVRALGGVSGLSEEEYGAELADEVGYSLASVEAEFGIAGGVQVAVWREGSVAPPRMDGLKPSGEDSSDVLVARLSEVCGGAEVHSRSLRDLPPCSEGLAKRAAEKDARLINLVPAAWRAEEQRYSLRKSLLIATAAFLAVWLLGLAVFALRKSMTAREYSSLKTMVAALEAPAAEVQDLSRKIRSFEQYADRSRSALEALREVSMLLPQGVELTSFSYRKGGAVNVRGIADFPEPIYDFFQALERSEFFEKVEPGDIRSKAMGAAQKSEFSVTARLPGDGKEGT